MSTEDWRLQVQRNEGDELHWPPLSYEEVFGGAQPAPEAIEARKRLETIGKPEFFIDFHRFSGDFHRKTIEKTAKSAQFRPFSSTFRWVWHGFEAESR